MPKALAADPLSFFVRCEKRLSDVEDSKMRPGDIALNLGNERSLLDATISNPFKVGGQFNFRLAGNPAAAASNAYERKVRK